MALQKEKTYMVLNYNSSPVTIATKNNSYVVDGGTKDNPGVLPLTIEEIMTVNTNGYAFKYGCLRFEPEFEEDIYNEIRLVNWKDILTNQQIEDIIVNPTKSGLEKIISIDNEVYFDRVVGVYVGLKSIFSDISKKVEIVIEQRKAELQDNKRKSEILITKPVNLIQNQATNQEVESLKTQNEILVQQMAEIQQAITNMQSSGDLAITPLVLKKEDNTKKSPSKPSKSKTAK